MTKAEVNWHREIEANGFLERSGVGFVFATGVLKPQYLEMAKSMSFTSFPAEALVKVAIQFAFDHPIGLERYLERESKLKSEDRLFRAKAG